MAVPILLYHHIAPPPSKGIPSRSNYVSPQNFDRQMCWLHRLGIKGLSLASAMPYIRGERQGRVAALTFDDGFMSVFNNALPILARYDFSSTCFFVADRIAGVNDWDKPQARRASLMGAKEIRHFAALGHEVGSHTLTHPHLTQLDLTKARAEIALSKQKLEKLISQPVLSFAYPYGDENVILRRIVDTSGYLYGVSTKRGRAGKTADEDIFALPRHSIRRSDRNIHFLLKCLVR